MGISADGTGVYPYIKEPNFQIGQTVKRTKDSGGLMKGYTFEIKSIMKGSASDNYYYVCPRGITHLEKYLEEISISWE